jgi:hypothetical protein
MAKCQSSSDASVIFSFTWEQAELQQHLPRHVPSRTCSMLGYSQQRRHTL